MLTTYRSFVASHRALVEQVESVLVSLTYLIPSQFREDVAEYAAQVTYTAVQLLQRGNRMLLGEVPEEPLLVTALEIARCVEVAAEMTAHRFGTRRTRWGTVAAIEIIKAAVRVALLLQGLHQSPPSTSSTALVTTFSGRRSGRLFRVVEDWKRAALESAALVPAPSLPPTLPAVAGELLHIARPVIYALSLARLGSRSWRPWLLAMFTDLASLWCSTRAAELPESQCEDINRRRGQLVVYLARSPLFESFRPAIQVLIYKLSQWPLIGSVAGGLEYLVSLQKWHFYTSDS